MDIDENTTWDSLTDDEIDQLTEDQIAELLRRDLTDPKTGLIVFGGSALTDLEEQERREREAMGNAD